MSIYSVAIRLLVSRRYFPNRIELNLQTAIRREAYFAILTKLPGFRYEKNSSKVVEVLFRKGSLRQAIKWAEALERMHDGKTPSDSCPWTVPTQPLAGGGNAYSKRVIFGILVELCRRDNQKRQL